jgi:hypothetical protein
MILYCLTRILAALPSPVSRDLGKLDPLDVDASFRDPLQTGACLAAHAVGDMRRDRPAEMAPCPGGSKGPPGVEAWRALCVR